MNDTEFKKRLKETQFVVEATSNEMQQIWEKFSDEAMYKHPEFNKFKFEQLNPGVVQTIGTLDKRPICISMFWYKINGIMIMYWDATSEVVDHAMINKWMRKNCAPRWDNGSRLAHTNAMNFHHVLHHVQDTNKAAMDPDEQERQKALAVLDKLTKEREQAQKAALVTLVK